MRPEDVIQKNVCEYIATYYPDVVYFSDMSGAWLNNVVIAKRYVELRRDGFKVPDLIILEPNNNWHALMIEIKDDGTEIYKKDGKTFTTPTIKGQGESLELLEAKKYYATFGIGEVGCIDIIDKYMNNEV